MTAATLQATLQQALAHHQQGQLQQAEALYRQVLTAQPRHADALHYLGVLYVQCQHPSEGSELIRQSLAINPDQASAYLNLGNALSMLNKHDDAIACYDQALARVPAYADAHSNKAQALLALKQPDKALASCDAALACNARLHEAHALRGQALRALSRPAEALESYQQGIALAPQYAQAHMGLGWVLASLGRRDEAARCFQGLTQLTPGDAEAHNNLGVMLQESSQLDAAIASFQHALQINPAHSQAQANLGVAYMTQGRTTDAIACFRQALTLAPDNHDAQSHLVYALSFDPTCAPETYLQEARRYGEMVSALAEPFDAWPATLRSSDQPLRVALISGDLRYHSVGHFLETLLDALGNQDIELMAYATQALEDDLTARIKPHFKLWRCVQGMDDASLARRIHDDAPQILIDLAGHTTGNRLPALAWKPAPVQVSWLGYLASTGVPGIDHLMADAVTVPQAHEAHFCESIWRLPDIANCFTPPSDGADLEVGELPALKQGYVTFGCFQAVAKLSDEVLSTWGSLFKAMLEARLLIQSKTLAQVSDHQRLSARLLQAGIAPERVTLQGPVATRRDFLARHQQVDIVLDTFPYPGITTTCEALWMGVPTVTLAGQTMLSRQGASLLACAGLPDWVADQPDAYVKLALTHTQDLNSLAALRARLREQVMRSPLFDAPRFALAMAQAWRGMWAQHCQHHQRPR